MDTLNPVKGVEKLLVTKHLPPTTIPGESPDTRDFLYYVNFPDTSYLPLIVEKIILVRGWSQDTQNLEA